MVEMIGEPEYKEDRGTANCLVLPGCEARTVETLVLGRIVPGIGRVLLTDKLEVEI